MRREGRTSSTPILRRREGGRDHGFYVSDGTFARLGRGNSDGSHCRLLERKYAVERKREKGGMRGDEENEREKSSGI